MRPVDIISDAEIDRVHSFADFGDSPKRNVVNDGLLKAACGSYQGSTSKWIIQKHGLIDNNGELTVKGRKYLWSAFANNKNF